MDDNARMASQAADVWPSTEHHGPIAVVEPGIGWESGETAAHRAIDSGTGMLLIVGDAAPSHAARAVGALLTGLDASRAIPSALSPLAWMQACAAVRDRMPALRRIANDPVLLARTDASLAHATAVIVTAVRRHVPVVVSGPLPHVAAVAAQRVTQLIGSGVQSGFDDEDPVAIAARHRLDVRPWIAATVPLSDEQRIEILRTVLGGAGS